MLRLLKAHQEHYLGYMANKLPWRYDPQDSGNFIAAEFSLGEKKRDNSTDTYLNIINKNSDLCQVCGKGSKADSGKNKGSIS